MDPLTNWLTFVDLPVRSFFCLLKFTIQLLNLQILLTKKESSLGKGWWRWPFDALRFDRSLRLCDPALAHPIRCLQGKTRSWTGNWVKFLRLVFGSGPKLHETSADISNPWWIFMALLLRFYGLLLPFDNLEPYEASGQFMQCSCCEEVWKKTCTVGDTSAFDAVVLRFWLL